MHNKHRKLFVIKQPKGCKFMPKIHQNTFGGRAPPGPAGERISSPDPQWGLLLREGRKGRGGGLLLRGWTEGYGGQGRAYL